MAMHKKNKPMNGRMKKNGKKTARTVKCKIK